MLRSEVKMYPGGIRFYRDLVLGLSLCPVKWAKKDPLDDPPFFLNGAASIHQIIPSLRFIYWWLC